MIEQGKFEEGYVIYVLKHITADFQAGRVKKLAGAVYTAISKATMLQEYLNSKQPKRSKKKDATQPIQPTKAVTEEEVQRLEAERVWVDGTQYTGMNLRYSLKMEGYAII